MIYIKRIICIMLAAVMITSISLSDIIINAAAYVTENFSDENDIDFSIDIASDAEILASGDCAENISWFVSEEYVLYINGKGYMNSFSKNDSPWHEFSDNITEVIISDGINSIGEYAFYNCTKLTKINLSDVLVDIEGFAFYGCEMLTEINIPQCLYSVQDKAFFSCSSLETVDLPASCSKIGKAVFQNCKNLKNVTIRSTIRTIPESMFEGCESLLSVKTGQTITEIGERAFFDCHNLSSISLFAVHSLGKEAFANCESLSEINIRNLDNVPSFAFSGCKNLSKIILGEEIHTVGINAFSGCTSLNEVILPESVGTIKPGAFGGCTNLREISILNDSVNIGSSYISSDEVFCETIPASAVIKANCASNADSYADINNINFIPLYQKEIESVELSKKPLQCIYLLGSDKEFKKDGAELNVTYKDGTSITLINRFGVNWENADINTCGEYSASIIYYDYAFPFEVTVRDRYIFSDIPESRILGDVFCRKDEFTEVCFVPEETQEYTLAFNNASAIEISSDIKLCNKGNIFFTEKHTYEKDKAYYFYIKAHSNSENVRISEIDDIYFEIMTDGNCEAVLSVVSGDIVIPSMYGNAYVTKIADNFIAESSSPGNMVGEVRISDGIREIGVKAFAGHGKNVDLPSSVKTIGNSAFKDFKGNLLLPLSVENIGDGAFTNSSVGDVVLSENIRYVGNEAFSKCNSIESVTVLSSEVVFDKAVFSYCKNLKSVKLFGKQHQMGEYMFRDCVSLETVEFTSGLSKIPDGAFYSCSSLVNAGFISEVSDIGSFAFYNCKALSEVDFHPEIKRVSTWCFYGCESIKKIDIPDSVSSIGEYAFCGCSGLTDISLGSNLKIIEDSAFGYVSADSIALPDSLEVMKAACFIGCEKLTEVTLPSKITFVPSFSFAYCSSLQSVYSKGNITTVDDYAFFACSSLETTDFWDSVESIGMYSFAQCSSLESLSFEKVNYINSKAFRYCNALKYIDFPSENTYIGNEAFFGCENLIKIDVKEYSTVGEAAFSCCKSLEQAVFRDNAILGKDCLAYCDSLKQLYLLTCSENSYDLGVLPSVLTVFGYKDSLAQKFADENKYEFVAVEGHTHVFTIEKSEPEKCFEYTKIIYTCECGYTYVENLHHTGACHYYGDFVVEKSPTCTEYGLKSRYCYCGKSRTDITLIDPLGHTEVVDIPAVVPVEALPGYTHQSHCAVCGETVVERQQISHTEYDIKYNENNVTAEKFTSATADSDGENILITFELRNNLYMSSIDRTVIYKVGEVKLSDTCFIYNASVQKPDVIAKNSKGEVLIKNKDYKVVYTGDSIYPGNFSVRLDFIGNYSGSKTLNYRIIIEEIIPEIDGVTENSIVLSWRKGHTDLNYRIYSVDKNNSLKKISDTKSGSYEISSLSPDNEYRFLVWAYVTDTEGHIYWGEKGEIIEAETESISGIRKLILILKLMIERIRLMFSIF